MVSRLQRGKCGCSKCLKMAFFFFFANFDWRSWNDFLRNRWSLENYFNHMFFISGILEKNFLRCLMSKTKALNVWKGLFTLFCKFLNDVVETIFWKSMPYLQNCLNAKFFIGDIVEDGFKAALRSKTNLLSVWKLCFPIFCNILCDKVETIFWETNSDPSKLFQSKAFHGKHFRQWFQVAFRSKMNVFSIFWESKAESV